MPFDFYTRFVVYHSIACCRGDEKASLSHRAPDRLAKRIAADVSISLETRAICKNASLDIASYHVVSGRVPVPSPSRPVRFCPVPSHHVAARRGAVRRNATQRSVLRRNASRPVNTSRSVNAFRAVLCHAWAGPCRRGAARRVISTDQTNKQTNKQTSMKDSSKL